MKRTESVKLREQRVKRAGKTGSDNFYAHPALTRSGYILRRLYSITVTTTRYLSTSYKQGMSRSFPVYPFLYSTRIMARAVWKKLLSDASIQRSSQTLSVIGGSAYIYGGELRPREPVDSVVYRISADSGTIHLRID